MGAILVNRHSSSCVVGKPNREKLPKAAWRTGWSQAGSLRLRRFSKVAKCDRYVSNSSVVSIMI